MLKFARKEEGRRKEETQGKGGELKYLKIGDGKKGETGKESQIVGLKLPKTLNKTIHSVLICKYRKGSDRKFHFAHV